MGGYDGHMPSKAGWKVSNTRFFSEVHKPGRVFKHAEEGEGRSRAALRFIVGPAPRQLCMRVPDICGLGSLFHKVEIT